MSDVRVKIGDFGFSTPDTGKVLTTSCGSPPYAAPELFQYACYEGPPVDIWAAGVLLYYMLTKTFPFPGEKASEVKRSILGGEYTIPNEVSKECQEVIAKLLTCTPDERPRSSEILQDPWLAAAGLAHTSTRDMVDVDPKIELETLDLMRKLGMPVSEEDRHGVVSGEPRDAVAGTYRILLHCRLHSTTRTSSDGIGMGVSSGQEGNDNGSVAQEFHQGGNAPVTSTNPTTTTGTKSSKTKKTKSLRNKKSGVCTIS